MLSKFLSLDEFITPRLIRPFYLVALGLVLLWGLVAIIASLGVLIVSPGLGLYGLIAAIVGTGLGVMMLRIVAELLLAVFRLHDRFVGGHPKDPIPE